MTFSTLDQVASGTRVFIDAPIFIYHFTGASQACRTFLRRCELGELDGVTSIIALTEVTHRLMMLEAVLKGLVSPGNVAQKLRKRPDVVRKLDLYQEQVAQIPSMDIEIVPLDLSAFAEAGLLRRSYGLLTNDSLLLSTAQGLEITAFASADRDFDRPAGVTLYCPGDIKPLAVAPPG